MERKQYEQKIKKNDRKRVKRGKQKAEEENRRKSTCVNLDAPDPQLAAAGGDQRKTRVHF